MMPGYDLSVIIAVQYAEENLAEILRKLEPGGYQQVEFLFCSAGASPAMAAMIGRYQNARIVDGQAGSLIPHLWRDGILAAQADKVALGTAHCIPSERWVQQLLAADMTSFPGIGGVIGNDSASTARDWAVYLLRYISFAPPRQRSEVAEIAADNALYRRADIMAQADLLEKGFWEPSFHARFRDAGHKLLLDPDLQVVHRNRYSTRQFFGQRLFHGREFGMERAGSLSSSKRLLLIALSPFLPLLFLSKIVLAVLGKGSFRLRLLVALPWLLLFLLAWGIGEARGYISARQKVVDNNATAA
ncbi:MAG: hypothetical protein HKO55_01985 [Gammaproteobacteria bacterium]|nr:hypothetical protein [Gammaproteobacteria bacterium]